MVYLTQKDLISILDNNVGTEFKISRLSGKLLNQKAYSVEKIYSEPKKITTLVLKSKRMIDCSDDSCKDDMCEESTIEMLRGY